MYWTALGRVIRMYEIAKVHAERYWFSGNVYMRNRYNMLKVWRGYLEAAWSVEMRRGK